MLRTIGLAITVFTVALPAIAADISGTWDFQGASRATSST
jgi:hypothetical protein